ncbi:MAG: DUF808 domain-containing protein [Pontibacterium sp.]
MAGASLLTLIDDIATLLDDIAALSKVAVKKTAGVLGDDLALNAQQVSGVRAEREWPIIWAVAKGSLLNKGILVPSALVISHFAPWLIGPLLVLGGLYLCFEGAEKVLHYLWQPKTAHHDEAKNTLPEETDVTALEQEKIKGAIRTDFILSAEIIVITLGSVAAASFMNQVWVLITVSIIVTVGVYGLVAMIVKFDDVGLSLLRDYDRAKPLLLKHRLGLWLVQVAPKLMKALTVLGTLAMFLVGGGILTHEIGLLHHVVEAVLAATVSGQQSILSFLISTSFDALAGAVSGLLLVGLAHIATKLRAS